MKRILSGWCVLAVAACAQQDDPARTIAQTGAQVSQRIVGVTAATA